MLRGLTMPKGEGRSHDTVDAARRFKCKTECAQ